MANEKHVKLLRQGPEAWLQWQLNFGDEEPDLGDADLRGLNLSGTNLCGADMYGASLGGADLSCANLESADLRGADLSDARLCQADLSGAALGGANLAGADLSGALVGGAGLSMPCHPRLTFMLRSREVAAQQREVDRLAVIFTDGSSLTIKLAQGRSDPIRFYDTAHPGDPLFAVRRGEKVSAVGQCHCDFMLVFESISALTVRTEGPASSVVLQDSDGTIEYTD